MRGSLIVITGTGTGIGKTHVARALLLAAAPEGRVFGYKPVESGVTDGEVSDADLLDRASTFHVKQSPGLRLHAGLSPHLAAELEGVVLDWSSVARFVDTLRDDGVHVLVELPGGLFSPLAPTLRNVDALGALGDGVRLLVAPNRLGVLHDVGAAITGAKHLGVRIDAVGLVVCDPSDASAGRNARELERFVDTPIVGVWDRASPEALATCDATVRVLYTYWLSRLG